MTPSRTPVRTAAELLTLDADEVLEGYLDGLEGETFCGENRSRSYWHGYRNGLVDAGFAEKDEDQAALARDVVQTSYRRRLH